MSGVWPLWIMSVLYMKDRSARGGTCWRRGAFGNVAGCSQVGGVWQLNSGDLVEKHTFNLGQLHSDSHQSGFRPGGDGKCCRDCPNISFLINDHLSLFSNLLDHLRLVSDPPDHLSFIFNLLDDLLGLFFTHQNYLRHVTSLLSSHFTSTGC